jgi:hypothetical protein
VRTARGAKERRDGEKKSAETGNRQVPRFGFSPGNACLPIEGLDPAIQKTFPGVRIAIPRANEVRVRPWTSPSWLFASSFSTILFRNVNQAGFPLCLRWRLFKTFCFLFLFWFFFLAGHAAAGTDPA